MSGLININGSDDPSYRYLMPRIQGKVEGRGNGIKTALPNVEEVAKALHRPPMHIVKYFGCELGAQCRWDTKGDRGIVNGAFQTSDLQEKLFGYIKLFVMCPSCELPETDLVIKSDEIRHKCNACGSVELVDMSHRLCTFILREHNNQKKQGAQSKKDERRKRRLAAERAATEGDAAAAGAGAGAGEAGEKKSKKEKKDKSAKKEKKDKKDKKAKKEKKAKKDKKDSADEDVGALDATVVGDAVAAINAAVSEGTDLAKAVKREGKARDLGRAARVYVAVSAVFQGVQPTIDALTTAVADNADALKSVASKAKQDAGLIFVSALERHCVDIQLTGLFPIILKLLIDEEAIQEEDVSAWHASERPATTHSTVTEEQHAEARAACAKLVATFDSSDSDSDSDSGSDSN